MINKKKLAIAGFVALVTVAAILVYRDTSRSKIEITGDAAGTLKNLGIEMTGNGKVEMVPIDEGVKLPPAPTLIRSTDFPNTLTVEAKKITLANLEVAIAAIKKNPKDNGNWVALGAQRKALGDYEGARDAWEYAKALNMNDVVAWNNLGDLYHFYLKDYKKSEENWKKTISLKPDFIQGYRGLYELYLYSMKEKSSEIPTMLKQGIEKNPAATDLKALLADYEKTITQ